MLHRCWLLFRAALLVGLPVVISHALLADPVGVGLWLDQSTGQIFVGEGVALLAGGAIWIGGIVSGLLTSWLVLP